LFFFLDEIKYMTRNVSADVDLFNVLWEEEGYGWAEGCM